VVSWQLAIGNPTKEIGRIKQTMVVSGLAPWPLRWQAAKMTVIPIQARE
jgi:hypothetical protein